MIDDLKKELTKYPTLYRFIEKDDNLTCIIKDELENGRIDFREIKDQNLYKKSYTKNIQKFIQTISN